MTKDAGQDEGLINMIVKFYILHSLFRASL